MAKEFSGVIKGLDQIQEKLKTLESKMVKNINRSAARAGAVAIKNQAASNLPAKHKKKVDISPKRRVRAGTFSFKIGPKAEHWGLTFLEYGAKPHDIGLRTKKALELSGLGFAKSIRRHPGVTATRFLSRAISEGADDAFKAIGDQYWKRINKVIK